MNTQSRITTAEPRRTKGWVERLFLGVLAIVAAVVFPQSAFARSPTEAKYVVVGGNDDVRLMTDALGMWGPKGAKERGRSIVWMRWEPLTPAGMKFISTFSGPKPEEKTRALASVYLRTQVDCKLQRFVTLSVLGHNASGNVLFSDGEDLPRWEDLPKNPESFMRKVIKTACASPFVALPDADDEFYALTRAGNLTRKETSIGAAPSTVRTAQSTNPLTRPRCINPATGLQMMDPNGSCAGNDVGGSRYGQDDRTR